ncbi:response regulator transcription factor [Geovibrio thiophilus]|uniref:Phosphate regulon transcriptional regulatory protein PhoB n=1 Tax=Geovibrio thiophilus TaxID=139438 RepID=A0A410JXS4_9BACT|nr:response regulator transcription factor [Geovibrio thiophilus]QAR32972.1 response regulator transcription factor [Geovibrio thiophilus]
MEKVILVVDDDPEILEIIRLLLSLEKYTVLTASTGMEGIAKARGNNIDLIVLDLNLPDVDGQQICRLVRKEKDVPILILSARDNVSDKVICLEYGADDYLTKPFENIELTARIKAILRRTEPSAEACQEGVIQFFHISIDQCDRTVHIGGEKINITPKEFELLMYFYDKRGQVLSRDEIVKDIWGKNTVYSWSRSLDVHVKNLRQKIETNPKNPDIIKTVSGVGYKVKK